MSKVLILYNADYADEFSVYGFAVYESELEWERHLHKINESIFKPAAIKAVEEEWKARAIYTAKHGNDTGFYHYDRGTDIESGFGTNESINYSCFKDYESSFTVKPIDEEEYIVLKRLFGDQYSKRVTYGHFLTLDRYDEYEEIDSDHVD